jgi:hypothetical protein
MTMTIEGFILYNIVMWTMGWYLLVRNGEKEYDGGFLDAVQLHSEGRLTYTFETVGEDEGVLTIEVRDEV